MAEDGEQAIARARDLLPDVIVMDLGLPKIDGREAIRRLKSDPRTSEIVIIALTGRELPDHGREAGCDEYLLKPLSPDALAAAVRAALAARGEPHAAILASR